MVDMTPDYLDQVLATLKKHGATSAHIKSDGCEIAVVFGPEPLPPGAETTPGGWKGPERLDVLEETAEVP